MSRPTHPRLFEHFTSGTGVNLIYAGDDVGWMDWHAFWKMADEIKRRAERDDT